MGSESDILNEPSYAIPEDILITPLKEAVTTLYDKPLIKNYIHVHVHSRTHSFVGIPITNKQIA